MGLAPRHPHNPHLASQPSPLLTMGNKNGVPVLRDEDVAALVKSSGMEEAQVKESFEAFKEQHPNGKMKPKDFREMMAKSCPRRTRARWRSTCSGSTTATMTATSTSSSSWSSSTSCRM